jgi:hypothetical protein
MPAQYMFKDIPVLPSDADYVDYTVAQMDRFGIERALVGYWEGSAGVKRAREALPEPLPVRLPRQSEPRHGRRARAAPC